MASPLFWLFMAAIVLALTLRLKGARHPAALLSVFCLAYSLVAVALAYY